MAREYKDKCEEYNDEYYEGEKPPSQKEFIEWKIEEGEYKEKNKAKLRRELSRGLKELEELEGTGSSDNQESI